MDERDFKSLLGFYRKVVTDDLIASLVAGTELVLRDGIYKHVIVIWLMIFQRLNGGGSLALAVEELRNGTSTNFLRSASHSNQARKLAVSPATGGYARGRERMSVEVVGAVADRINASIVSVHKDQTFKGHKVFVVDGSSIRLEHTQDNLRSYPQCSTKKTKAHYPLARIVIATDAVTRVTLKPEYGAFHGKAATSELELGAKVLPLIAPGSVILADRYYGCFRFVQQVFSQNKHVLARLSEKRAHRFIGRSPKDGAGEISVSWTPSKHEAKKYTDLPKDTAVAGRCIWHTISRDGFRSTRLILFTTLDLPASDIIEMYALRWNVEDTLRDLKTTFKMDFIHAKTPEMVHKELILGVVAYNLVRHFMAAFASAHKISTNTLSFTAFLVRLKTVAPMLLLSNSEAEITDRLKRAFLDPRGLVLPKRSKPRQSEPRKKWPKGDSRIFMQGSRELERKKLFQPLFRNTYVFN